MYIHIYIYTFFLFLRNFLAPALVVFSTRDPNGKCFQICKEQWLQGPCFLYKFFWAGWCVKILFDMLLHFLVFAGFNQKNAKQHWIERLLDKLHCCIYCLDLELESAHYGPNGNHIKGLQLGRSYPVLRPWWSYTPWNLQNWRKRNRTEDLVELLLKRLKGMKILEATRFNPDMMVGWYWCDRVFFSKYGFNCMLELC